MASQTAAVLAHAGCYNVCRGMCYRQHLSALVRPYMNVDGVQVQTCKCAHAPTGVQ